MSTPSVGIVGGGLLGLTAAYRLAQAGASVSVYERDAQLGGLAGTTDLGGYRVDRYYHVVLPTDDRVRGLAADVGLGDETMRFAGTRVGFYQNARLASMSSVGQLLTFPGLNASDRLRLIAFVGRCQLKSDYADLEDVALEAWLRKMCGNRLWERLWRPLLDSKFDGRFADLPATYLWARTRRMAGTRDKAAREVMGTIVGGYQTLVDRLAERIRALGGEVHTSTPVSFIPSGADGRAVGVVLDRGLRRHDLVATTQLRPALGHILAPALQAALGPDPCRYLGIVCLVARVRHSVSPYYTLNITDRRVPLTTVVETTHVVDPERVGGHLIYVPRYVDPDSPELERSSADIRREYLALVRQMFPAFDPADVIAAQVARARVAEPVHVLGGDRAVDLFPAPGLAVASSAHIYPELVNGQAIVGVADRLVEGILSRLPSASEERFAA